MYVNITLFTLFTLLHVSALKGPSSGSTDTFREQNIFNYTQVYNLHVSMFFLLDIDTWTRILLTLLSKCVSTS